MYPEEHVRASMQYSDNSLLPHWRLVHSSEHVVKDGERWNKDTKFYDNMFDW